MATILLAANLIENIAVTGWGHLQLVRYQSENVQSEIEVQAPPEVTLGNWTFPIVRDHTTTGPGGNTSNYGVEGEYNAVELDIGDRIADDIWDILVQVHKQFSTLGTGISYDLDQNSNSYASTLLNILGLKFEDYFEAVRPAEVSSFPGAGVNVLQNAKTAIPLTLVGHDHHDIINIGMGNDAVAGGKGGDEINTGGGDDILIGGSSTQDSDATTDEALEALRDINPNVSGLQQYHPEWEDGVADTLKGGFGLDTYLISHENNYDNVPGMTEPTEWITGVDTIDERTGDGQGNIMLQNHRAAQGTTPETTTATMSKGVYAFLYDNEFGSYFYNTSPLASGMERAVGILVSNLLDEDGNPIIFLVPTYPDDGLPYAAIKGFRNGDFGITLEGYTSPKEGTSGDDVIQGDSGQSLALAASENADSVGLSSDPDSDQRLHAGAGNDIVHGRGGQDDVRGDEGDDQLYGDEGDDRLAGGAGDDALEGGTGSDAFVYQRGDGIDHIIESDNADDIDVLELSSLTLEDVSLVQDGTNLVVTINATGDTIVVEQQFPAQDGQSGIERIKFSDGQTLDRDDFSAHLAAPILNGTANDDVLEGDQTANILRGGAGNDHLIGGSGSDAYFYSMGDGSDQIDERTSDGTGIDVLRLVDIDINDITMERSGSDLLIHIADQQITVSDQFNAGPVAGGLELVKLSDGMEIDRATIAALGSADNIVLGSGSDDYLGGSFGGDSFLGGSGNDTLMGDAGSDVYVYRPGDASDTIEDGADSSGDTDVFVLTDLNVSDVSVARDGSNLRITVNGTGEIITVEDQFASRTGFWGIERIEFGDGTRWDRAFLMAFGDGPIVGTPGNDTLKGAPEDDVFEGGQGDDLMTGEGGSDTYIYASGDGSDTVEETQDRPVDTDVLRFTDLNQSDIQVMRNGRDLFITIIATGDVLRISEQFASLTGYWGLERIEFADGSVWDKTAINAIADAPIVGTAGNDTLIGGNDADVIVGGLGDDRLEGIGGDDSYLYASGDGNDVIYDQGNGSFETDVLKLTDLTASEVAATRSGEDLVITVLQTGQTIVVEGQYFNDLDGYGLERIEFADSSSWDYQAIIDIGHINLITGTAGDDHLTGIWFDETLQGGLGDDTLAGSYGSDTYVYAIGDGNDSINDLSYSASDTDVLRLDGLNASDISAARNGNDLEITILSTGAVITVERQFYDPSDYYGLERIEFADGTSWNRAQILDVREPGQTIEGTNGDDTLVGAAGDDVFRGGQGDDNLFGAAGADTYIYSLGDGTDYIDDEANEANSVDTLRLTDLNASDISAVRNGVNLDITVLSTGDVITIDEQWYDSSAYWGFEKIEFADGTVWDRAAIMAIRKPPIVGTNGNDTLIGTSDDDTLDGGAGNDTLNGGDGDDIHLGGAGNDILLGNVGNDSFDGGDGIDTLNFTYYTANHNVDLTAGKVLFSDGTFEQAINIENVIAGSGANQILGSAADNRLDGGAGNDVISGNDGNDVLIGGDGDDTLRGGIGDDTLAGGTGLDNFDGGDGFDTADFSYSSAIWTLDLQQGKALSSGTTETLVSIEALIGGTGNDVLVGNAGANQLEGYRGNDTLTGGAGDDVFVFKTGFGKDTLIDFTAGAGSEDVLDIGADLFSDFASVLAAATQVGADTVITHDANTAITLKNVALKSLHHDDFRFTAAA